MKNIKNKTLFFYRFSDECYILAADLYKLYEESKTNDEVMPDRDIIKNSVDKINKYFKEAFGNCNYNISEEERQRRSENMKKNRYIR